MSSEAQFAQCIRNGPRFGENVAVDLDQNDCYLHGRGSDVERFGMFFKTPL